MTAPRSLLRICLIITSALTLSTVTSAQSLSLVPGAPAGVLAFVGVAVVPMDMERVISDQTVLIEGGRIAALGPVDQVKIPAEATRIDGRGKYLIPGLADMHVHVALASVNEYHGYDSTDAERRLFLWLANGVTTVRNMDHLTAKPDIKPHQMLDGSIVLRLRARAAAGEILSPRIYTSGSWSGPNRNKHDIPPESVATYVAAYKASGYDFLKVRLERPEIVESLAVAASRVGIPLAGHVRLPITSDWALQAGYASIEHTGFSYLRSLGKRFPPPAKRFPEEGDRYWTAARPTIQAIAMSTKHAGVWNCPTLSVKSSRAHRLFTKALADAGAGLLLGTDAPLPRKPNIRGPTPLHGYPDMIHHELQLLVQVGLTPYQALATGTTNPADFLGWQAESGTITVGKRADLVLLRGNPLANIRNTAQPLGVMIGGRWLSREQLDRRLAETKARTVSTP